MRQKKTLFCLIFCLLLTGCAAQKGETQIYAMNTLMDLTAFGPNGQKAVDSAAIRVNELETLYSTQRQGSDIWNANHSQGETVEISPETAEILQETLKICEITDGALDPTIYPLMVAWGFPDGGYRVPDGWVIGELLTQVDYTAVKLDKNHLTLPQGMSLDLGATGKGYAGDKILELWREMGITSGLLDLGHNIQCLGAKPDGSDWTVAIRHPDRETDYLATVTGADMAVVTSGGYQRNFTENGVLYHHIMDPSTGYPASSGLSSVTIVGERGVLCDGLSTAVYVMGLDKAAEVWRAHPEDFDMVLYTDDGELYITAGLEGRVTPAEGLKLQVIHE